MTPRPATLIGREEACARVAAAIDADRPVLVTGEAGIGKTSLVAAAVAETGRDLVAGAGFQTLADLPYTALRVALGRPVAGTPAEVAQTVEAAVGGGVLFLDDLQWVDPATRAIIPLLVGRVTLVVASRFAAAAALPGLPPDPFEVVALAPLAPADAERLARSHLHDAPAAPVLAGLLARAGGNPLLIEELAREGRPSATAERAIAAHVAGTSDAALEALRRLAIADHPVALPLDPAVEAELVEAALVRRAGGELAIRHSLFAETVLAGMTEEERRATHAAVADLVPDAPDAALHLARAGRRDEAAERALAALEGERDVLRRAQLLRIAAECTDGVRSLHLRLDAAAAFVEVDDPPSVLQLLDGEPEAWLDGGDPHVPGPLAEACALWYARRARGLDGQGGLDRVEEAVALGRRYPADPLGPAMLRLDQEYWTALARRGHADVALEGIEARIAAEPDAPPDRALILRTRANYMRLLATGEADVDRMRADAEASLTLTPQSATGRLIEVETTLLVLRGSAEALAFTDEVLGRAEAARLPLLQLRCSRIQTLIYTGREPEAVVAADELCELPIPFGTQTLCAIQKAEALTYLGRLEEATAALRAVEGELRDEWMDRGEWLQAAAAIAYWQGVPTEAIRLAAEARSVPTIHPANYLGGSMVCAWAEMDLGRRPEPFPEGGDFWFGEGAYAEERALRRLADGEPATGAFEEAAAIWAGNLRFRELVCRWGAGEAARREGLPGAADRLRDVHEAATAAGYEGLAARVRRSLRLAGADVRSRAERSTGAELLTAREREILDHVAAGRSNIEIARRMGLGRPTVARMLSSAMAKLGVDSRAQAVTRVAELA